MTLWLTLLGMALVTFALRAAFLLLPPGVELPPLFKRALRYVPAAALTALWGRPRCWRRMNNCPPALSQSLWRGAGAPRSLR
jgi:branched-subunit amino acid transport protein